MSSIAFHPLTLFVSAAVPLQMMTLAEKGGPDETDMDSLKDYQDVLGAKGDMLLFKSDTKGETADLANRLAHAIAVMSYAPGGITVFGQHFEARPETRSTAPNDWPPAPPEDPEDYA